MSRYDLCLAWNWEYDADFAALLEAACRAYGLSLLQVTPHTLDAVLEALADTRLKFRVLFDRASDNDARFVSLVCWATARAVYCINARERALWTWDKAAMHLALIEAGLQTPYTIVLPPYQMHPTLSLPDLSPLGMSFTIKPAHGGGGEGVVTEATSPSQVCAARQEHPTDQYLLQAHVVPTRLGERPAWFRVIYCLGQIYPCWWDTTTHRYTPLTPDEEERFGLAPLRRETASIARVCRLELFSTEIALTAEGLFVVVDYVNDQIDLRLQSRTADGVPDDIVRDVADRLAALALAHRAP